MFIGKIIPAVILISFSFFSLSCDNAVDPVSNISGKVYSYNHQPVSNIKVTIQDNFTYTSFDGSFNFKGVSFPYDATVVDSLGKKVTFFKYLSTDNINLVLTESAYNLSYALVQVTVPQNIISNGLKGKIIFTDYGKISSYSDISLQSTQSYLIVYINQSVTGRIMLLTYKKDSTGRIISYENYGESLNISLQPGGSFQYTFDSSSISLDPGEKTITGSFTYPYILSFIETGFYLSFANSIEFENLDILFSQIENNIFNFIVPTGIPSQFKIIAENASGFGSTGGTRESFIVLPDVPNNFEIKSPPSLISPEDEMTNVTRDTKFSYEKGGGKGIYAITVRNRSRYAIYTIITADNSFTLGDCYDAGLGSLNNNDFSWYVNKYGPAESMNDHVTNYFYESVRFYSGTYPRDFTTAP